MIKDLLNNYGQEDNIVNYTSAGNPNAFGGQLDQQKQLKKAE